MKRVLALLLVCIALLGMIPTASAASADATKAAEALYELGLFRGNGTLADGSPNFALDQTPTRNQAVIMLVRLLGKEQEALAGSWEIPFTDVPENAAARPYIGYAYANGLTNGTSATTYSGTKPIRGNQYITFVLRALGYESGKDFAVSTAWELSDALGITAGQYNAANSGSFLRAGIAEISCSALSAKVRGSDATLLQKLKADGAVPEDAVAPEKPAVDPDALTFRTIDPGYYQLWGNVPMKEFVLQSIRYAVSGSDVYFRVNYSGKLQKFFVVPAGMPQDGVMGTMSRYAAPEDGVFTCKVSISELAKYPNLIISPSEDGKSGPDYRIFHGYLQLSEDGRPAQFRPVEKVKDDSYEVADFKFLSAEVAEVTGGRLYRIRFTNDAHRNIQFWTIKAGQGGGFDASLARVVHPEAGETEALYFVPKSSLEKYDMVYVRVRDSYAIDPNGGSTQTHSGIDLYF